MNVAQWFRQVWPADSGRRAVLADYAALHMMKHLLTDIALRGFVYSKPPLPRSEYEAGLFEGRRHLALELLELANMPAEQLWQFIERKPAQGDRT